MDQDQKTVHKLLERCIDANVEIVSYGLAPNPNGFCYEVHEPRASDEILATIDKALDQLSPNDVRILRSWVFGSES